MPLVKKTSGEQNKWNKNVQFKNSRLKINGTVSKMSDKKLIN